MSTRLLSLTFAAAGLAPAAEVHFGVAGITPVETARIGAFCPADAAAAAAPCEVTLLFHTLSGRVVKQSTLTLEPDTGGFLDLRAADLGLTARRGEIIPCLRVGRGTTVGSLQILDNLTLRTRILTSWGDRPVPQSGEVHFGLAGITPYDTARIGAFCPAGLTRTEPAEPCEVTLLFHTLSGRVAKQSTVTLQPDTGVFLDLIAGELGLTARRGEIIPCLRVGRGAAAASFELIDTLTALTTVLTLPAAPVSP